MIWQIAAVVRLKTQSFFPSDLSIGTFWCMLHVSHAQSPHVLHGILCPTWYEAQERPGTFGPRLYFPDACIVLFVPVRLSLFLTFLSESQKAAQWKQKESNRAVSALLAPLKPSGRPWPKFIALSCLKGESIRENTCSQFLHLLHDLSKGISPFTTSVSTSVKINCEDTLGI